jgi:regulator of protease activity HflC (stomatin/prohibitin superfamily)
MTVSSKRPVHVALVSLILSIIFFGIAFFLGRWSGFSAVSAVSWLILSVAFIWFVLCLQFYQRSLAEQEKLDASQLVRDDKASAIFQAGSERATLFTAAQNRLQIFEKWFIPIFAAIIAAFQIGIGLYLLKALIGPEIEAEMKQPLLCGICLTAIAFMSFLMSRYSTGMSAQPEWKPLRAGGSSLLGIAVVCFILAVCLSVAHIFPNKYGPMNIMAWVIPGLLVILGAETAVNLVMDIYRPRLKGRYSRSAFDSRLLGVINEPGGILRSAADAIDYQFGFEVSQTWFYKSLEEWIVPLLLFGVLTLYLLSCIVVVAPDEEAIIEHFGNPLTKAGNVRSVGPGLALKYPWPIDIAYKHRTKMISEISIGFIPKIDPKTEEIQREPLLWGQAHHEKEYRLLVASEQSAGQVAGAVPVSLVIAAVPVQYRIKDLYSFVYKHDEPEKVLEFICYRELTKYAASAKLEVDDRTNMEHSLLGAGRTGARTILTERIQKAADDEELGVQIVFLGLQGIHPPTEVAADYQKVISAVQKKQSLILQAQAQRNNTLSMLVGSVQEADKLFDLALRYRQAEAANEDKEKIGNELDNAFAQAKGHIFNILREAQSYAFENVTLAQATGERFAGQIEAYRASPEFYLLEQKLASLEAALSQIRKYVVVTDEDDKLVITIDVEETLSPSIYDMGGIQENTNP